MREVQQFHDIPWSTIWRRLIFSAVFLLASPTMGRASDQITTEASATQLRAQVRSTLRRESIASSHADRISSALDLCDLYFALRMDPRHATSAMIRGDAVKLRRRLISIQRRYENELTRNKVPRPSDREASSLTSPAGAAGGAAIGNEAWRLVELIQRIIEPDFWQSQGGPGAIRYFALRRVLVIRATSDVHEQVKDLLTALR